MSKILSKELKKKIKDHIEDIESKSSAELVCVVTNSSDKYEYILFLYAALFAFIAPFVIKLFNDNFSKIYLYQIEIIVFIFVFFVLKYSNIKYNLIPKKVKWEKCRKLAYGQFFSIGVNKTENHKAILVLICLKERYIKVIADEEINEKVSQEKWQNIVKNFITFAKKDDLSNAILKIIDECGEILKKEFPRDATSKDELSNDVIEL